MASPGSLKGQRRGTCGHAFDLHEKCARCREKKLGDDLCVKGQICNLCDGFSEAQREALATPSYKIRKEKRAGSLVSPKDVTVIGSVDAEDQPSFQPTAQTSAQGQSSQPVSYVTSAQFEEMNDKWAEHFARFEALLSRGNVFSTPKSSVPGSSHPVLSDQPFLHPSAQATGPVGPPAELDQSVRAETKPKKKSKKSKSDKIKDIPLPVQPAPAPKIPGPGDFMQEPVFKPVSSKPDQATSATASSQPLHPVSQTGPEEDIVTGPTLPAHAVSTSSSTFAGSGDVFLTEHSYRDSADLQVSEEEQSEAEFSGEEEGELSSDGLDRQEQTEDLTYR